MFYMSLYAFLQVDGQVTTWPVLTWDIAIKWLKKTNFMIKLYYNKRTKRHFGFIYPLVDKQVLYMKENNYFRDTNKGDFIEIMLEIKRHKS